MDKKTKRIRWAVGLTVTLVLFAWLGSNYIPRRAELSGELLTVSRITRQFELPLADIASAELLDSLPEYTLISGKDASGLLEGVFELEGYGECRLCLNFTVLSFIALEDSSGGRWLFNLGSVDGQRSFTRGWRQNLGHNSFTHGLPPKKCAGSRNASSGGRKLISCWDFGGNWRRCAGRRASTLKDARPGLRAPPAAARDSRAGPLLTSSGACGPPCPAGCSQNTRG